MAFLRNRIALVTFSAAALTALGCSLIVEFDESRIPGDGSDTGTETSVVDSTPIDTGAPDTAMDSEQPDTTTDDTADTAPDDTADSAPDDTADSAPADTADSAPADTADSAADTADTTPADTADTAAEDTADTTPADTADTATEDTATADTAAEDTAPADTGPADTGVADSADAGPTISFAADIQPIFNNFCTSCHSGSGAPAGMSLVAGESYANIVNVDVSSTCGSGKRVVPFSTTTSMLWLKTSNSTEKCGDAMPAGSDGLAVLSPADFAKLETWITEGALNN